MEAFKKYSYRRGNSVLMKIEDFSSRNYEKTRIKELRDPGMPDIAQDLSDLSRRSNDKVDYDSIFTLVRRAVKAKLGVERSGIGLALSNLPAGLGAFWEVGGNFIVLNKTLVRAMAAAGKSQLEINSFVFVILMHEYLHSIGILDEASTRETTRKLCVSLFPEDHPAYVLGSKDPWQVYPFLLSVPSARGDNIEFVTHFSTDSVPYIM
ncbi:MAG: hypothetical protein QXJ24_05940 [Thermoplasmatales archaeon]